MSIETLDPKITNKLLREQDNQDIADAQKAVRFYQDKIDHHTMIIVTAGSLGIIDYGRYKGIENHIVATQCVSAPTDKQLTTARDTFTNIPDLLNDAANRGTYLQDKQQILDPVRLDSAAQTIYQDHSSWGCYLQNGIWRSSEPLLDLTLLGAAVVSSIGRAIRKESRDHYQTKLTRLLDKHSSPA